MANKSGDSSLHDWFNKSKSSDGKKGWVQLGGKYAGKPCAKQEGQKTKPKCGSSKMKRNLNKDEEAAAFRRKNNKDPNPNRKGKAINVATEETQIDEKCWDGYTQKGMKKKGNKVVPNCVRTEELELIWEKVRKKVEKKTIKRWWDDDGDGIGYEKGEVKEGKGEKDACYKKVKSRYSVWPSAYASGALVKCRKVGAANWGNKTKKESYSWRDDLDYQYIDEDWQKVNKKDKTDGMSQKAVNAYKRENPGSKLKTAVTGKVKKGSKSAKRRSSYCSRSKGQMKMHNINCKKTPDKAICKARKRWKC